MSSHRLPTWDLLVTWASSSQSPLTARKVELHGHSLDPQRGADPCSRPMEWGLLSTLLTTQVCPIHQPTQSHCYKPPVL